jgi:hypothetical protein
LHGGLISNVRLDSKEIGLSQCVFDWSPVDARTVNGTNASAMAREQRCARQADCPGGTRYHRGLSVEIANVSNHPTLPICQPTKAITLVLVQQRLSVFGVAVLAI